MRKFWAVLLTGLLALLVVFAGPAMAKQPLRGDTYMKAPSDCGTVA